jgi:UPF0716 family protein affecting phage T7 exclusion
MGTGAARQSTWLMYLRQKKLRTGQQQQQQLLLVVVLLVAGFGGV